MGNRRRIAQCNVHEEFDADNPAEQHDPMQWRGGIMFQPTGIRASYQMQYATWSTRSFAVVGRRILKQGGLGQMVNVEYFLRSDQAAAPDWAKQWAADNRPDQLPWEDEA